MTRIIDTHCHIYPDAIARKAVEAVDRFYGGTPAEHQDGTVGTLIRTGRASGISHFIVHSVATRPGQVEHINRFIAKSAAESGGAFTGLGTLHPDANDLRQDFTLLQSLGLKGVKLHPDIQQFRADDPRAMRIYEMCEEAGIPVCMHTGDDRFDHSNPRRVAGVLRAFPRLRLIGAHFGGWSVWEEAAKTLPDFPNMVVDTSSSFYALKPDRAKAIIERWGTGRVMFGTDYPMWPQRPEIDYLYKLDLTDDEYDQILWRNAAELFGIEFDD